MFYLHNVVKLNVKYLKEFANILIDMDDNLYCNVLTGHSFSGSIGAHSRHIIEFYEQFLISLDDDLIDYDSRKRNKNIETTRQIAIEHLHIILSKLDALVLNDSKSIETKGNGEKSKTSLGREINYLSEHTVHHFALIRLLAELQGFKFDLCPDFGIAHSTSIYRLSQSH